MAAERILEMKFNTEQGKTQTVRIYDAKDPLTDAEIVTAMDNIIAKNIFTGTSGSLTSKLSAQVLVTNTQDINLG